MAFCDRLISQFILSDHSSFPGFPSSLRARSALLRSHSPNVFSGNRENERGVLSLLIDLDSIAQLAHRFFGDLIDGLVALRFGRAHRQPLPVDTRAIGHSLPVVRVGPEDLRVHAARDRANRGEGDVQRGGAVQRRVEELGIGREERGVVVWLQQTRSDGLSVLEERRGSEIGNGVREDLVGSHRSVARRAAKQRVAELAIVARERHAAQLRLDVGLRAERKSGQVLLARDKRQRGEVSRIDQRGTEVHRGERQRQRFERERSGRRNAL